jgi:hypothetical protein
MRVIFILFLIVNASYLFAQNKSDSGNLKTIINIDRVKERQKRIDIFADSINNFKGGDVPSFLYNACFDLQASLWNGFHSDVSLRWTVLQRVNNKKALKMLLKTGDKKLDEKCGSLIKNNPEEYIPLIDKSFLDLIRKRYKQMD